LIISAHRKDYKMSQITLEVAANPTTVVPGEKTTITVTAHGEDRKLLPGAKVTVAAGGGEFLPRADSPIPPPPTGRPHLPTPATGLTNEKGQFTTWWVELVNPGAPGYGLDIDATKEGFTSAKAEILIKVK
jgi:hypothetical protein